MGAKTTGPHIGKPQNWRNSSTKSRANLVVPASVMGTSRKHRFNSRRYSGLAGKIWVTPRYIVCLVFRIFPGQTDECPSAGVAALEFPGCAVHTYLLIRSRQPLLPKCLKKQSEPQHQPESFSFAKDSRKTSNKSKTGGITMQRFTRVRTRTITTVVVIALAAVVLARVRGCFADNDRGHRRLVAEAAQLTGRRKRPVGI